MRYISNSVLVLIHLVALNGGPDCTVAAFTPFSISSNIKSPTSAENFSRSSIYSSTATRSTTVLYSTRAQKLSRPERKRLEREKKNANKYDSKRVKAKKAMKYELHSENVSELTPKSSADDVIKAIKR